MWGDDGFHYMLDNSFYVSSSDSFYMFFWYPNNSNYGQLSFSWSGNHMQWYSQFQNTKFPADVQWNSDGVEYNYIGFG